MITDYLNKLEMVKLMDRGVEERSGPQGTTCQIDSLLVKIVNYCGHNNKVTDSLRKSSAAFLFTKLPSVKQQVHEWRGNEFKK